MNFLQVKFDSAEKRRSCKLLNMIAYRFFSIKNVKLKVLFNFLNGLPQYCRWRHSDVLINIKLLCLSLNYRFLKQAPAAYRVHLPAERHASTQRAAQETDCGPTVQISSKNKWPLNFPMDYRVWALWGAMLEAFCKLKTKPKTIAEVKETL